MSRSSSAIAPRGHPGASCVDGPHCVCEMAAALDERQNNVSNHLARLRGRAWCGRAATRSTPAGSTTSATSRPAPRRWRRSGTARDDHPRAPARPSPFWPTAVAAAAVAWLVAWFVNLPARELGSRMTSSGWSAGRRSAMPWRSSCYDVPKVLLLLLGIVTVVSFLRSLLPARARPGSARRPWHARRDRRRGRVRRSSRRSAPAPRCRSSSGSSRPASRWA